MTRRILIVDDHPLVCRQLQAILALDELIVEAVSDGRAALERLREEKYQLLITDWRMPDLDGLELLTTVRAQRMPMGVLVMTGYGDTQTALEAMKAGADNFVTKPFEPDRFRRVVKHILDRRELIDELEVLRQQSQADFGFRNLISRNARMRRVFSVIQQVGPLGSTVLIHGETGTGKELVAQAVHDVSGRRGEWVALNCAAIQESLLESELFGHEKGAFTDAQRSRKGRFEQAHMGTLFLDGVAEISPLMQAKLLRVLQSGQFERVGGAETLKVDVRIVAASNKRLDEEVAAGRFRSDLFYRLSVVRIDLPALRERREDLPLLVTHFLQKFRDKSIPPVTEIDHEAMQALLSHDWPGNVRELENAIKAAVAMTDGTIIHRAALPASIAPPRDADQPSSLIDIKRPLPEVTADLIQQVEREYFARLLAYYRGNVARCAQHSELSRRCVSQKLLKYRLNRAEFRLRKEASPRG